MSELTQPVDQLPPHILVVDDDPDIRRMITVCLQKGGARLSSAENVSEALRLLQQKTIDAVVTDVMMPGEDGIALLSHIHESWPEIPVILMTGHAQLQMAVNAVKNGAFDFIYKPFDFEYLRKIVERAINYRNLQRIEKNYRAELEETVAIRTKELRESMLELDFARTALQQAATDKSNFMSTISHEMRTPMNGVLGSIELLSDEITSGPAAEYLAMARQSADSMMTLINQLLSFNSMSSRNPVAALRDLVDLHALLRGIIEEQQPLFKRKGITLVLQLTDDLPLQIWTDREKLCRLFEILLDNALKFTEHGSVTLAASRDCCKEGEEILLCTLTDSGIGIPQGMLERIFEPFVQGDGSLTRSHEGVGLGLAIARQNASLLNGRLWAEHLPEGGSRFSVSFKINTP